MHTPTPSVTVIITTYSIERIDEFTSCVDNIINQNYPNYDIILVTETEPVYTRTQSQYGNVDNIHIHHPPTSQSLAEARNSGAEQATGDIIAFIDDDAIAASDWISELVRGYNESDCHAIGGPATPKWPDEQPPRHLPEEFYWLVGVTHKGAPTKETETRNTFGCNISFKRETFLELHGFNTDFGKDHGHNLQGEETELCTRLHQLTGHGVYYIPTAIVQHEVYEDQLTLSWLIDRAYWQGVTKLAMQKTHPDALGAEQDFLRTLITESIPKYVREFPAAPKQSAFKLASLVGLTSSVGIGYLRAMLIP